MSRRTTARPAGGGRHGGDHRDRRLRRAEPLDRPRRHPAPRPERQRGLSHARRRAAARSSRWRTRPTARRRARSRPAPIPRYGPYEGSMRRIHATDARTVVFELCDADPAFLAKIASPTLAIDDTAWLQSRIDPTAERPRILTEVNGTGPFRLDAWDGNGDIALTRSDRLLGRSRTEQRRHLRRRSPTRASGCPSCARDRWTPSTSSRRATSRPSTPTPS